MDLSVNYEDDEEVRQQSAAVSSKKVDTRSTRSATQWMRAELHADLDEQEASGTHLSGQGVFHLFRCLLSSCNSPNYCYTNPIAGLRRELNGPLLKSLVKYAEGKTTPLTLTVMSLRFFEKRSA
jgi:hypothetical protein